jgi:hemolysin activation/secretion protein
VKNTRTNKPSGQKMAYLGLTILVCLINRPLQAQYIPGSDPTPLDRSPLPTTEGSAKIPGLPELPELPELPPLPKDDDKNLSSLSKIKVKQFQFDGNQVFSDQELTEITNSVLETTADKALSPEQLQEVKNKITAHYIQAGYVNSGAIIPDQKITDGTVIIKIIEGVLVKVEATGNENLRTDYIENRLKHEDKEPLELNQLQDRLQMLQQNPLFERIQAELGPGVKLGEGILKIHVDEAPPRELKFTFNNHRSPSVGAYRGQIEGWYRNFTGIFGKKAGFGDTFYLRYGLTEGLNDFTVRYDFPLNRYNSTVSLHVERSDSEVVEAPFNQLDVESEADTYALTFRHPVYQEPEGYFDLSLRLEKRTSKTFLLGQPFSFSPGVRDGVSELSVIRFSQDWLKRSPVQVLAARASFNFGIDALDSTINDDGSPDSQFFSLLGQFQYVRRLDFFGDIEPLNNSQIIFRTDFQVADQDLLPLEKLSIGGASTVRGYRENVLTRDNGLISSLEWRVPVGQLSIPGLSKNHEDGSVELATFFDYGRAWNTDSETPYPKDIYSVGLGFHWNPNKYIHTEIYWGHALQTDDIPDPDEQNLQDDGVHFELSVNYPF